MTQEERQALEKVAQELKAKGITPTREHLEYALSKIRLTGATEEYPPEKPEIKQPMQDIKEGTFLKTDSRLKTKTDMTDWEKAKEPTIGEMEPVTVTAQKEPSIAAQVEKFAANIARAYNTPLEEAGKITWGALKFLGTEVAKLQGKEHHEIEMALVSPLGKIAEMFAKVPYEVLKDRFITGSERRGEQAEELGQAIKKGFVTREARPHAERVLQLEKEIKAKGLEPEKAIIDMVATVSFWVAGADKVDQAKQLAKAIKDNTFIVSLPKEKTAKTIKALKEGYIAQGMKEKDALKAAHGAIKQEFNKYADGIFNRYGLSGKGFVRNMKFSKDGQVTVFYNKSRYDRLLNAVTAAPEEEVVTTGGMATTKPTVETPVEAITKDYASGGMPYDKQQANVTAQTAKKMTDQEAAELWKKGGLQKEGAQIDQVYEPTKKDVMTGEVIKKGGKEIPAITKDYSSGGMTYEQQQANINKQAALKLEEPVRNAVMMMDEESTISSGFHGAFSKDFNGIDPSWAIVFKGKVSDEVKKAADAVGLKLNVRELFKGSSKAHGDEGCVTDVYLPNVPESDAVKAKETFDLFSEYYIAHKYKLDRNLKELAERTKVSAPTVFVKTSPIRAKVEQQIREGNPPKNVVADKIRTDEFEPEAQKWIKKYEKPHGIGKGYSGSIIGKNRKTILSLDPSTICPAKEREMSCVYCYVEHGRGAKKLKYTFLEGKTEISVLPYNHELLSMPPSAVECINTRMGGQRMFAFSDYRPDKDKELVQKVLDDASKINLFIKPITKVKELIDHFGDHPNALFNITVDNLPGLIRNAPTIKEALIWKAGRPNIKIRATAMNPEEAEMFGNDPNVDVLTLYHAHVTDPQKIYSIIKLQNPKAIEAMGGKKAFMEYLSTWKSMQPGDKIYKELLKKFPDKLCCKGGKCWVCPVKCGFANYIDLYNQTRIRPALTKDYASGGMPYEMQQRNIEAQGVTTPEEKAAAQKDIAGQKPTSDIPPDEITPGIHPKDQGFFKGKAEGARQLLEKIFATKEEILGPAYWRLTKFLTDVNLMKAQVTKETTRYVLNPNVYRTLRKIPYLKTTAELKGFSMSTWPVIGKNFGVTQKEMKDGLILLEGINKLSPNNEILEYGMETVKDPVKDVIDVVNEELGLDNYMVKGKKLDPQTLRSRKPQRVKYRHDPKVIDKMWDKARPELKDAVKRFMIFRDELAQLHGIENVVSAYAHHAWKDNQSVLDKVMNKIRGASLPREGMVTAPERLTRMGAKGYVKNMLWAMTKASIDLKLESMINSFLPQFEMDLTQPIPKEGVPSGWSEYTLQWTKNPEGTPITRMIKNEAYNQFLRPVSMAKMSDDLKNTLKTIDNLCTFVNLNYLMSSSVMATNFISGALQYSEKVVFDFIYGVLMGQNPKAVISDLTAPIKALLPYWYEEFPLEQLGLDPRSLQALFPEGEEIPKALTLHELYLRGYGGIETYWKRAIAIAVKESPYSQKKRWIALHAKYNSKEWKDSVIDLDDVPGEFVEIMKGIDHCGYTYYNIPHVLDWMRKRPLVRQLSLPYPVYGYKYGRQTISFLDKMSHIDPTVPMDWKERLARILSVSTMVYFSYLAQKEMRKKATWVPPGDKYWERAAQAVAGRVPVGTIKQEGSEYELNLRTAKYPFMNIAAAMAGGPEGMTQLMQEFFSEGLLADVLIETLAQKRSKYEQYIPVEASLGMKLSSTIPFKGFLIPFGRVQSGYKRSAKTFKEGFLQDVPIPGFIPDSWVDKDGVWRGQIRKDRYTNQAIPYLPLVEYIGGYLGLRMTPIPFEAYESKEMERQLRDVKKQQKIKPLKSKMKTIKGF